MCLIINLNFSIFALPFEGLLCLERSPAASMDTKN